MSPTQPKTERFVVRWSFVGKDAFKACLYIRQINWFYGVPSDILRDDANQSYSLTSVVLHYHAEAIVKFLHQNLATGLMTIVRERTWQCEAFIHVTEHTVYLQKLIELMDDPQGLLSLQLLYDNNCGMTVEHFKERLNEQDMLDGRIVFNPNPDEDQHDQDDSTGDAQDQDAAQVSGGFEIDESLNEANRLSASAQFFLPPPPPDESDDDLEDDDLDDDRDESTY